MFEITVTAVKGEEIIWDRAEGNTLLTAASAATALARSYQLDGYKVEVQEAGTFGRYTVPLQVTMFAHSEEDAKMLGDMLADRVRGLMGNGQATCRVLDDIHRTTDEEFTS